MKFCPKFGFRFTCQIQSSIKTAEIIGLAAIALIAYGFVNKAVALGTLNFYPDKIVSLVFDNGTPILTISLLAQNTSSQSFTIKSISGNVYSNNTLVGNISEFGNQMISSNSESVVTVNVRMQLVSIVNDLIRALQFGNFAQVITLDGNVNVDNYQIPLKMDYTLGKLPGSIAGGAKISQQSAVNNLRVAI